MKSPPTTRPAVPGGTMSPELQQLVNDLARQIPTDVLPAVAMPKAVAGLIGSTEAALAQDRYLGKGIPFTRVGRRVRYLRADVLAYLAANRVDGAA